MFLLLSHFRVLYLVDSKRKNSVYDTRSRAEGWVESTSQNGRESLESVFCDANGRILNVLPL